MFSNQRNSGIQVRVDEVKVFLGTQLLRMTGEIPNVGDFVMSRGWCFEIVAADDKKILQVKAEELICNVEDDDFCDDDEITTADASDTNPIRKLMRKVAAEMGGGEEESTSENVDSSASDDSVVSPNGELDGGTDDDDEYDDEGYSNRKSSLLKDARAGEG